MRFVIGFLGIIASVIAGFGGWFWLDADLNSKLMDTVDADYKDLAVHARTVMPHYNEWETTAFAALFLLVGGALGMLGSMFTVMRRGRHGAVLMILALVGPALLNLVTLVFTAPLALVAILSALFIGPRRPVPEATS